VSATYPTASPHDGPVPERGIAHARTAALLDLDPDLGVHLDPARFASARGALQVRLVALPRGEWAGSALTSISPDNVGLLLIDGVVAREVVLEDTVSTELLGPGDLIRPWSAAADQDLLQRQVQWQVLADARLAVLGRPFGSALPRFPEVNAALLDRACARSNRLATMQAIAHLNSVERRVIALFWHLAERWGRVIGDGVVVPLTLSHRLLGELVGARRPTVSAAIAALERAGRLARRPDATWLLLGAPAGTSGQPTGRRVPHRRRLLGAPPAAGG
jgi:CRP/FNR family cyclic AMP-dependent transcriptional regulator